MNTLTPPVAGLRELSALNPAWHSYFIDPADSAVWSFKSRGGRGRRKNVWTKLAVDRRGHYPCVMLHGDDGKRYRLVCHRLALRLFRGEPGPGQEACHLDNRFFDFRLTYPDGHELAGQDRIVWGTRQFNREHFKTTIGYPRGDQVSPKSRKYSEAQVTMAFKAYWDGSATMRGAARLAGINPSTFQRMNGDRSTSWKWLKRELLAARGVPV